MIDTLRDLDELGDALIERAGHRDVRLIWRAQTRCAARVVVREGRPESTSITRTSGQGLQVVGEDGRGALASRDDFLPEPALALFDRVVETAAAGSRLSLQAVALPSVDPLRAESVDGSESAFEEIDLQPVTRRLVKLEREIRQRVPGTSISVSYRAELECWRIRRSDGTDVLFSLPRCTLAARAIGGDESRHGVSASVSDPKPDLLDDPIVVDRYLRRAVKAATLARSLPQAPPHPAGSFPLVIDYGLAKGLAHEAFGHASEADGFRSSVLADGGQFRRGMRVGADHVSIVDEPVKGDHAWQPFSANGVRRRRTLIVDRGRLFEGLSDLWSAAPGGVPLTGAARAESFRHAPLPRMSNIRIEVQDPLPAPGSFEDYDPERVAGLLSDAGVFRRHPRLAFLSGYSGGQVNTATGDFVFHCKAIYELGSRSIRLHRPAIFSGSMFGALQSVREAFGPLLLDAIGQCGKWGQSVPSSGGSHYFLVLEPHEAVRLGGRNQ